MTNTRRRVYDQINTSSIPSTINGSVRKTSNNRDLSDTSSNSEYEQNSSTSSSSEDDNSSSDNSDASSHFAPETHFRPVRIRYPSLRQTTRKRLSCLSYGMSSVPNTGQCEVGFNHNSTYNVANNVTQNSTHDFNNTSHRTYNLRSKPGKNNYMQTRKNSNYNLRNRENFNLACISNNNIDQDGLSPTEDDFTGYESSPIRANEPDNATTNTRYTLRTAPTLSFKANESLQPRFHQILPATKKQTVTHRPKVHKDKRFIKIEDTNNISSCDIRSLKVPQLRQIILGIDEDAILQYHQLYLEHMDMKDTVYYTKKNSLISHIKTLLLYKSGEASFLKRNFNSFEELKSTFLDIMNSPSNFYTIKHSRPKKYERLSEMNKNHILVIYDIFYNIATFIPTNNLPKLCLVCRHFDHYLKSPRFWEEIDLSKFNGRFRTSQSSRQIILPISSLATEIFNILRNPRFINLKKIAWPTVSSYYIIFHLLSISCPNIEEIIFQHPRGATQNDSLKSIRHIAQTILPKIKKISIQPSFTSNI